MGSIWIVSVLRGTVKVNINSLPQLASQRVLRRAERRLGQYGMWRSWVVVFWERSRSKSMCKYDLLVSVAPRIVFLVMMMKYLGMVNWCFCEAHRLILLFFIQQLKWFSLQFFMHGEKQITYPVIPMGGWFFLFWGFCRCVFSFCFLLWSLV